MAVIDVPQRIRDQIDAWAGSPKQEGESKMNVDIIEDEIKTLEEERNRSNDPTAQDRITKMINERKIMVERGE